MVKIVGIMGSPREDGNTAHLVKTALKSAEEAGADTELINIASMNIEPCIACDICKNIGECGIYDDMRVIIKKLQDSD